MFLVRSRSLVCPIFLALLLCSSPHAHSIDLECEAVTQSLIKRLVTEELLKENLQKQQQAQQIALELCTATTESAQKQHEADKAKALENWFFEYHPEKAGNRRLKKTH
ncbi:MAG: hypothetical protein KUG71_08685 [Porticoccaceae bacterium]|nr:hypothetical protein [Porticoccaceae bacterium]